MKEPILDAERLAALLENRTGQDERAKLLAHMAGSDDALGVYADAVAAVGEAGAGSGIGIVAADAPVRHIARPPMPSWRWVALAAVLAGVVAAPLLLRRTRSANREDPARFVNSLTASRSPLPAQWSATPWPGMRGGGQSLTATARAARLGARLVDLELAVRARDTTVAGLAAEIASLLEDVPAAGPVATMYREAGQRAAAGATPPALEPLLKRARLAVAGFADADVFQIAAWAEAGRVAAARRDAEYFRAPASRALLGHAAALSGLPAPARAVLRRIQSDLLPAGPDWSRLEPDLGELLQALGG